MTVRQINLSDEELFERLFDAFRRDRFARMLIAAHIQGHRDGDQESTEWIRRALGWDV